MQQITKRVTVENRTSGGSAVVTPFGGDGSTWTSNRIGPLGFVVPSVCRGFDDATRQAAVCAPTPVRAADAPAPIHHGPVPTPTPASPDPAAAAHEAESAAVVHPPVPPPIALAHRINVFGLGLDFAM